MTGEPEKKTNWLEDVYSRNSNFVTLDMNT